MVWTIIHTIKSQKVNCYNRHSIVTFSSDSQQLSQLTTRCGNDKIDYWYFKNNPFLYISLGLTIVKIIFTPHVCFSEVFWRRHSGGGCCRPWRRSKIFHSGFISHKFSSPRVSPGSRANYLVFIQPNAVLSTYIWYKPWTKIPVVVTTYLL